MEKVNIRTDLSIGDQKIGAKMNTNGLWSISEVTICGLPIEQGVEAIGKAMLDLNEKVDLANKGREPPKKKPVKKTVEKTLDETKPDEKTDEKPLKKPRKNKEKTEEKPGEQSADPPASKNKNNKLEISGGTQVKPDDGESGEKGKNPSG